MRSMSGIVRRVWREDNGQTLVLAAVTMTLLIGFMGLSVDIGLLFRERRVAQIAADAAAVAAANELSYGTSLTAARTDAALNGFTNGVNGVSVTMNNPPLYGPRAGNAAYVEVIVSVPRQTYFMGAFHHGTMTVAVRAVAALGTTQNCVYALGTSGTDLSLSNGVVISLPNCAIYGNSPSSTDLAVTGGATLTAAAVNLVGGASINGGSTVSVTPNTGVSPASDPLAGLPSPSFTASSCAANPNLGGGGTYTIGPTTSGGTICYNGLTIANGATATLKPGFYIINGQFSVAGGSKVSGTGVTLYLPPGGSVNLSNGINFSLIAPTTGTYNGVLFYQSRTNTTTAYVEGGSTSVMQGILYFPAANLTLENGTSTTTYASVVASTITFAGGTRLQNYALVNGNTPLDAARLTE